MSGRPLPDIFFFCRLFFGLRGYTRGEVMRMSKKKSKGDSLALPLGLGMALAQNTRAMAYFSALAPEEKEQVISRTHQIQSKEEMRSFVQGLGEHGLT